MIRASLFLVIFIAFTWAHPGVCSPRVIPSKVNSFSKDGKLTSPSEYVLFELKDVLPAKTKRIGDLKITDNGVSDACNYQQILALVREKNLKAGGNAFKITSHQKPNLSSDCHRVTGVMLLLTPKQIAAHNNSNLANLEKIVARQKFVDDSLVSAFGDSAIYAKVTRHAQFPGGDDALMTFLRQSVKYPASAAKDNITGLNVASFVVEKNGSISNIKIIHSLHQDLDEETMRIIRTMPLWTPANVNGKVVRVRFFLPMRYFVGRK